MSDPLDPPSAQQQALVLDALAWLSTNLTAINSDTNRAALRAGAAALRAQAHDAECAGGFHRNRGVTK